MWQTKSDQIRAFLPLCNHQDHRGVVLVHYRRQLSFSHSHLCWCFNSNQAQNCRKVIKNSRKCEQKIMTKREKNLHKLWGYQQLCGQFKKMKTQPTYERGEIIKILICKRTVEKHQTLELGVQGL